LAILIAAKDIAKTFGARPLFEGLNFVVESGERIGLIGPNGAGKSTLLRILAGEIGVDEGELSLQRGLRVGFLEQTPKLDPDSTVDDIVTGPLAGELLSRLELSDWKYHTIDQLSGGWKKRVALARELAKEPELLLLDEPTNHLDIESILWLEGFLAKATFATVTITHDRLFLQRVASRILELDRRNPNGLLNVRGDYATYVERKEELLTLQQREETVLKNTLRRETEWLRRGAKARTTKQQARIQAHGVLSEKVEELEYRNQTRSARLDFQSSDKKPKRLMESRKVSKAYGDRQLFRDVDVFVGPGSRIGLLGSNGCGKSTLIRVLLGTEEPDSGTVLRSEHLKVAYFEQNRETLNQETTLRKTLCPAGDHVNYRGKLVHIIGYLDRFMFRKEQVDMMVGKLSGGEQSRVALAKLMLQESNVLVLDEPTNDLDVETLNVLQECLTEFDGAVLLVTHDRYFLDQVATEILAFPSAAEDRGHITAFAGLDQWETWRKDRQQNRKTAAKAAAQDESSGGKKRKMSYNETRELSQMESKIHAVEERLSSLQAQSLAPQNQSNASLLSELFTGMAEAQKEMDTLYARWAELEALSKLGS
jgi:ABC transport system ATP-binding/permease protein